MLAAHWELERKQISNLHKCTVYKEPQRGKDSDAFQGVLRPHSGNPEIFWS